MTSIVYQDRASGSMYVYKSPRQKQRSFFEQSRNDRIRAALEELEHVGNINIFLCKRGKLRMIATHYA